MCLLTYFPPGVMPDLDALHNGAYLNDDGHGFAVIADGRIIAERGLYAADMIAAFDIVRREHPDGPALFHSRFATHGDRGVDNCHPFAVGGDERTVLAHNGILPDEVQPAKGDPRSDTRITAEEFLPEFGSLRHRRTRQRFARWMTRDNKMIILTVNRRYKAPAYILNEPAGIWDDGIWYSNDSYRPLLAPGGAGSSWDRLDRTVERCWACGAIIDLLDGECRFCGWCFDCGEMPGTCLCYTPGGLDRGRVGAGEQARGPG